MPKGTTVRMLVAVATMFGALTIEAGAANLSMKTGSRTTQPIGHYELCRQYPAECNQRAAKPAPLPATGRLWSAINRINAQVNASIRPVTDLDLWGREEVWSFPATAGDCEDYVIEKRAELMRLGIPSGNLLITVLRQADGDGHAVLTVRTTGGDFVLDNLDSRVRLWSETEYTFLKRQSERDSGIWLSINDGRADAVASVR